MRQIHICAWLLVTCAASAACSGDKFASTEQGAADTGNGASTSGGKTSGTAGRASGGSGTSYSGSGNASSGKPGGAGTATGGSSAGGSGPVAGGNSSGGDDDGGGQDCAFGSVKFRMLPGPDLGHGFLCDAGCGTGWLTITDAVGATAFSIFSACGAASCESCEVLPCAAAACLPTPLTSEGSELTWDGTYLKADTCGANMACQKASCVPAGKYKAKACAAINGGQAANGSGCMPKTEVLCAEAEFQFPGAAEVKLVLK